MSPELVRSAREILEAWRGAATLAALAAGLIGAPALLLALIARLVEHLGRR